MARIAGVSAAQAGQEVAQTYQYARYGLAQLTGRESNGQANLETDRVIEPLQMYAHEPGLLRGVVALEQATGELNRLSKRIQALAQIKAATLTHCEYCIDLGSQISRQCGLSDTELLALPTYRTSDLFSPRGEARSGLRHRRESHAGRRPGLPL